MNKKQNFYMYMMVNFIFAFIVIYYLIRNGNMLLINTPYILYAIVPFICIHILRIIRQYIILMENKMKLGILTKDYLKSSLTNVVVPFRIGELF